MSGITSRSEGFADGRKHVLGEVDARSLAAEGFGACHVRIAEHVCRNIGFGSPKPSPWDWVIDTSDGGQRVLLGVVPMPAGDYDMTIDEFEASDVNVAAIHAGWALCAEWRDRAEGSREAVRFDTIGICIGDPMRGQQAVRCHHVRDVARA